MKTDAELEAFCRAHYYCDEGEKWQPFENWDDEDIQDNIDNDVDALKNFYKEEELRYDKLLKAGKMALDYVEGREHSTEAVAENLRQSIKGAK